jgi:hypothetical protein
VNIISGLFFNNTILGLSLNSIVLSSFVKLIHE